MRETVILGGGMSGLSCAYHLKKDYKLFERSDEPGGLSRSIKQDGFIYDHTGHLLHLRNPYTLKLIPELLKDNLNLLHRSAWIYSHNTYTPYPYQANLGGLPDQASSANASRGWSRRSWRPAKPPRAYRRRGNWYPSR